MHINEAIFRINKTQGKSLTTAIVRQTPTNEQEYLDPSFVSWSIGVDEMNTVIEGTLPEGHPTWDEIKAVSDQIYAEQEYYSYVRPRQKEYPPVGNYIDAMIKGDQAAMDAHKEACLAVKAKYPKPETKPEHMNDPDYPGLDPWLL
jgi:hypothetical protein